MAVNHWSQVRQPVLLIGLDATVLFPLLIVMFRFPYLKWWLIAFIMLITIIVTTKVFKYQFKYVPAGIRKTLFGADKRTRKANRSFNF